MVRNRSTSNNIIRGRRLSYNISGQRRYKNQLDALVDKMVTETTNAVIALFRKPTAKEFFAEDASIAAQAKILTDKLMAKFDKIFAFASKPIAEKMVRGQLKDSNINLKNSLKQISKDITLKTDTLTSTLKETLSASIDENVNLIKSIPEKYLTQVKGDVMRSITTGNGLDDLIPALQKQKGITYRHAKNIALDQTRKVYNNVNRDRMQKIGVKKFEWVHSGGGQKPREDHIKMDGKIYSFDKLPVIDKRTGERGIPGQAINCGCTMIPVIEFNEG